MARRDNPSQDGGTVRSLDLEAFVTDSLAERNRLSRNFFEQEAPHLVTAAHHMAERFLQGGRLLAFGRGPSATDAQHVAVEFVHPVIVGKRALPALDLSTAFEQWLPAILRPHDMVMGFGPPGGDPRVTAALSTARLAGAQTFAFPGGPEDANYAVADPSAHPFVQQEMFEILYHVLWETVHVFLEHSELGHDLGEASFLYPYLGKEKQAVDELCSQLIPSVHSKADDSARLRETLVADELRNIVDTATAIDDRIRSGGKLILFGNGGSATDANDWALDCAMPPAGYLPQPAISLSMEPANLSAICNDVGVENVFVRQLLAHAAPDDVAVGISTSGGSPNILAALKQARKSGLLTIALLGYDGGEVLRQKLADFPIIVRSEYIPRIQEVQASIYHVLREAAAVIDGRHGSGIGDGR